MHGIICSCIVRTVRGSGFKYCDDLRTKSQTVGVLISFLEQTYYMER